MSARTSPGRPGIQALHFLAGAVGLLLLHACASPAYHRSGTLFSSDPPMPPPVLDTVQVHELRGTATVQSGTQRLPLTAETEVHENQPIQVGSRSTLRLAMGQRGLIELGPGSRAVVHKLPRDGKGEERATWLRLEQGYLRVVWSDERGDTPMEVSFGRWAARVGAGEHFFDARGNSASACSSSGAMQLSGVPEWTPKSLSEPCVTLEPHRSPVEVALREKDWDTLRNKRRLQPTLARAAQQQASQAVARVDRGGMRAVSWKPASEPGAFSAHRLARPTQPESVTYFPHTPPVIQIPATPPPEPSPAPAPVEQLAYVPQAPPVIVIEPEAVQATTIQAEDVPVVTSPPPEPDVAAVQLMEAEPPAAGVAPPALKWTNDLAADPSTLQPATTETSESAPPEETVAIAPPVTQTLPKQRGSSEADRAEWIVNVATYAAPELAQQHAQQLIAQNFNAKVRDETVRGRASYRVVIEGLPTEAAAQSAVADLGTKWGVRSAWAMRKR